MDSDTPSLLLLFSMLSCLLSVCPLPLVVVVVVVDTLKRCSSVKLLLVRCCCCSWRPHSRISHRASLPPASQSTRRLRASPSPPFLLLFPLCGASQPGPPFSCLPPSCHFPRVSPPHPPVPPALSPPALFARGGARRVLCVAPSSLLSSSGDLTDRWVLTTLLPPSF